MKYCSQKQVGCSTVPDIIYNTMLYYSGLFASQILIFNRHFISANQWYINDHLKSFNILDHGNEVVLSLHPNQARLIFQSPFFRTTFRTEYFLRSPTYLDKNSSLNYLRPKGENFVFPVARTPKEAKVMEIPVNFQFTTALQSVRGFKSCEAISN